MAINYKLALALKDAGFPQHERLGIGHGDIFLRGDAGLMYVPTLSELIESIDGEFFELNKAGEAVWICRGGEKYTMVLGSTSEEAVANLFLALNEKENNN